MDQLLARYPFLDDARAAVDEEGVDLAALVAEGSPAVDRALERLEACLHEGDVGAPHRDPRTELLSYPVARVLVSLLDVSGPYLPLSAGLEGDEWRLVARPLDDGSVPVAREELFVLVQEAVCERVAEGLPFEVPDVIADGLAEEVDQLGSLLADRRLPTTSALDAVVPEQFPPCMAALLERVQAGEDLPHYSRFSLVTFLGSIGLDEDQVAEVFANAGTQQARFQFEHVAGDAGAAYAPPSCATMVELGDCVNTDARCETIDHPLSYYADAIADAGHGPNARTGEEAQAGSEGRTGEADADDARSGESDDATASPEIPAWDGDVSSLFGRLS